MGRNDRQALRERHGERIRVRARIERYGYSQEGSVYLLTNVEALRSSEMLVDHLWMPISEWASGMRVGDVIAFDATVTSYVKGYFGNNPNIQAEASAPSIDFHLVDVANAEILVEGPVPRIK